MKNQLKQSDLLYMPNEGTSEYLHQGLACPTIEAHDILGDKGVQIIRDRIATMLEWRKTMFGTQAVNDYGFHAFEKFVELQNDTIFRIGATIGMEMARIEHDLGAEHLEKFLPDLVIDEKLKKNNYEKLIDTDHYIIEVAGQHADRPKNVDPAWYYRNVHP